MCPRPAAGGGQCGRDRLFCFGGQWVGPKLGHQTKEGACLHISRTLVECRQTVLLFRHTGLTSVGHLAPRVSAESAERTYIKEANKGPTHSTRQHNCMAGWSDGRRRESWKHNRTHVQSKDASLPSAGYLPDQTDQTDQTDVQKHGVYCICYNLVYVFIEYLHLLRFLVPLFWVEWFLPALIKF